MNSSVTPLLAMDEASLRDLLIGRLSGVLNVGRDQVDPAKSFDEYGLDSIDAVIATGEIGELLGVELQPEFLFYHRSVNAVVAALLKHHRHGTPAVLSQTKKSIFWFPGAGGREGRAAVIFHERMAPMLNFEPIQIGNWREWTKDDLDFEALATRACQRIKEIKTEGPLYLAGYSQGGQIAFATAVSLARAGRPVAFLGLLDANIAVARTASPTPSKVDYGLVWRALRRFRRYIGAPNAYHKNMRLHLFRALWKLAGNPVQRRRLCMLLARAPMLFRGRGGVTLDIEIQMYRFAELSDAWFAKNRYRQSVDAPVVLFRSEEPNFSDHGEDLGWRNFCSDLTVVPVRGGHFTMFDETHLDMLANRFVGALGALDHEAFPAVAFQSMERA